MGSKREKREKSAARRSKSKAASRPRKPRRPGWLLPGLALIALIAGLWWLNGPAPEPIAPSDPDSMAPQLADHVNRLLETARERPRDWKAQAELGLAYEANQMNAEARATFRRVSELAPSEPLAPLHEAASAMAEGDLDGAIPLLEQLTAKHRRFAHGFHRLGVALLELGRTEEAVKAFRRVASLAPGDPAGHSGLGDALLQLGLAEEAIPPLERARKLAPRNATATFLLGQAYRDVGRDQESQALLARSKGAGAHLMIDEWMRRLPAHAKTTPRQMSRALAFMNAGRYDAAIEIYGELVRWSPEDPAGLTNLGVAHMRNGDLTRAEEYLLRAQSADPSHATSLLNLALVQRRRGELGPALETVDRGIYLSSGVAHYHRLRAGLLRDLDRLDEAIEAARTAVRLAPNEVSSHRVLGDCLHRARRFEQALDARREAVRRGPTDAAAQADVGETLLALGRTEEARLALQRARQLNPREQRTVALGARLP